MPKAILPEKFSRQIALTNISDARWQSLKKHIPGNLSDEMEARLRREILGCVSHYLTRRAELQEGMASAWVSRRSGKRQPAPLERLASGLRMAADAWKRIKDHAPSKHRPPFHDDLLSDLRQFDDLERLAKDAERRLAGLRALGEPRTVPTAWRILVRGMADCFRRQGINPSATGRAYEAGAKSTWFQKFVASVQANLLGKHGRPVGSKEAFAAEIAKALRGDKKPGKAQK